MFTLIEFNRRINQIDKSISNKEDRLSIYCILGKEILETEKIKLINYYNIEIYKLQKQKMLIDNLKLFFT